MEALTANIGISRLDAPLARLAYLMPDASAAARKALDIVLAPTCNSIWPDVAWRASALTDDGFPVEFSWSSRDESIRWTAEVAAAETSKRARIDLALEMLETLCGHPPAPAQLVNQILGPTGQPDKMRFGAWIGGRHSDSANRYKLYAECPERLPPDQTGEVEWLEDSIARRIDWRMVGVTTDGQVLEFYGRVSQLALEDIERSFDRAGFGPAQQIGDLLRSMDRRKDSRHPFGSHAGVSVSLSNGKPCAISWFGPANAISFDAETRVAALIEAAELCGGQTQLLTALVGNRQPLFGKIGMVGLGAAQDGTCWVQAGWRPGGCN